MPAGILHVDMDAFFASVELAERPELRGKPVVVAGNERGVVLAATYEARAFGVHSGQPTAQAHRLCPHAVYLRPRHAKYWEVSRDVMDLFHSVTPLVEQISVDEAFLDVSGARRRLGAPLEIAEQLRRQVRARHAITCSVGIAASKSVAKIASARAKPDGVVEVEAGREAEFLSPLPVSVIWGVGDKTRAQLERFGVKTVGELAAIDVAALSRAVGNAHAAHLHAMALGRDPRPVQNGHREKSISNETTFARDIVDGAEMRRTLLRLAVKCTSRLRSSGQAGRTVGIKVRTEDFATLQRSRTLDVATDASQEVFQCACDLLAGVDLGGKAVRLLGVKVDGLEDIAGVQIQGTLGERDVDVRAADVAMDQVWQRFGRDVLNLATLIDRDPTSALPDRDLS